MSSEYLRCVQRGARLFDERGKRRGIVDREIGEDLSVHFAGCQSLLRPPKAPRAAFMICFLRLRRGTLLTARGMGLSPYATSKRLTRLVSPVVATMPAWRRRRFRLDVFFVRMWLLNAL